MKLVTFQSFEALEYLNKFGYLICDDKYIEKKSRTTYSWVLEKMNEKVKNNTSFTYPIWCWVKCYNNICPPKHKGKKIEGFDVKIVFNKKEEDVFITDFRRFSFVLNNIYIPNNIKEKEAFDNLLKRNNIAKEELKAYVRKDKYSTHRTDKKYLEVCSAIRKSFERCITKESNILQGCVWKIDKEEIESIEVLNDDGYTYGSLNYIRGNGKRIDWINDFYKRLK